MNTPSCYCPATGIFHLPDEVLNQIILLLTARERVPLGNSCRRFKALVFEDRKLLKYLDFSKKAGLTTITQIQQYFNNENACRYILNINARNVDCIKPGDLLNNSIGRAINLVEVNIHGTKFENLWQLRSFLEPLQRLRKLSIDWPEFVEDYFRIYRRILQKPLRKLVYLSVRFEQSIPTMFTRCLSLCKQLEELHMESLKSYQIETSRNSWDSGIKKLRNLRIVHYNGVDPHRIKEQLAMVLHDPERWADFEYCAGANPEEFYIEKDVEVCEELLRSERVEEFLNTDPQGWSDEDFNMKWALDPARLLEEALRITHEEVPEDFCCLSAIPHDRRHLLKVHEAKLLLKDPRYQISHLCLNHKLERDCNVHLLASAYPNLTELVLHSVTSYQHKSPRDSCLQRRLSKRCSLVHDKLDDSVNLDSSFKILVENTPNLRHFRLDPDGDDVKDWDLDTLHLISGWRNLETLHLKDVSCEDGKFLVEIGKKCKNLQKLILYSSWLNETDNVALFNMLGYCGNLRDVTIDGWRVDQTQMFSLLAKNAELVRVKAKRNNTGHAAAPWVSSMENLIRQCEKLTTIICHTHFRTEDDLNEAASAIKRMEAEFRGRPDFQIQVSCYTYNPKSRNVQVGRAFEDLPPNETFSVDVRQY